MKHLLYRGDLEDSAYRPPYQRRRVVPRLGLPLVAHICDGGGGVLKQPFQVYEMRTDARFLRWYPRALLDRREDSRLSGEGTVYPAIDDPSCKTLTTRGVLGS